MPFAAALDAGALLAVGEGDELADVVDRDGAALGVVDGIALVDEDLPGEASGGACAGLQPDKHTATNETSTAIFRTIEHPRSILDPSVEGDGRNGSDKR